jgi:hypothetical protein
MVVEVPRYRMAEPNPGVTAGAPPGPGSSGPASSSEGNSNRGGNDGAGSKSGSVLGMGAAPPAAPAPLPLPTASAPAGASKSLNLTLPRVDVYRSGIGPVRQPSLSDLANAQLRRGEAKDPVAEAVNQSENPDCLKPDKNSPATGLLAGPVAAYRAMTGKCK